MYCPGKASANGSVPCKTKSASVEAEPVKEQEGGKGKQTARRSGHQVDDGQGLIIARDFLQLSTQVTIYQYLFSFIKNIFLLIKYFSFFR